MQFSTLLATVAILCYTASASPLLIVPQFAPNESIMINGTDILSINGTDILSINGTDIPISTVEPRDRRPPPEEVLLPTCSISPSFLSRFHFRCH
jgi:hypothetical protein